MPLPRPTKGQSESDFISAFMDNDAMKTEYPDAEQRAAVAHSQYKRAKLKKAALIAVLKSAASCVGRARKRFEVHWLRKEDEPGEDVEIVCEICKVEDADDHTFVWGPALIPEVTDRQGDVISKEEIEETAHAFLADGGRPGLLHKVMLGNRDAAVVESSVLRQPHKISKKETLPVGTWMVGMRVYNSRIRKLVLDGELTGYSVGGQGVGAYEE